ncbi:MAG TPA: hypothetical protein DIT97_15365 [Gimesia maris]|uniref:Uncharacterized protein n=1 Tax=Gimesia maris TaxID=122 RepID=A0A3D3R657_9PLAN|nr:hypothetical protein [Gimesia maris]
MCPGQSTEFLINSLCHRNPPGLSGFGRPVFLGADVDVLLIENKIFPSQPLQFTQPHAGISQQDKDQFQSPSRGIDDLLQFFR